MPAPVSGSRVERSQLAAQLLLLLESGAGTVGVTTGLHGAGGFGKTTLAAQVYSSDRVGQLFPDGLLWVTVGEGRAAPGLAGLVCDLCEQLCGQRPSFSDPMLAGQRLGQMLEGRRALLVIDDVWSAEQLQPFMLGGSTISRLVTTRIAGILADTVQTVRVDQMSPDESMLLLGRGLPRLPPQLLDELLSLTGRWPLLLGLVNGWLRWTARDGGDPVAAGRDVASRLRAGGPGALDVTVQQRRDQAVRTTMEMSLRLLTDRGRDQYLRVSIFAPDTDIPVDMLSLAWMVSTTEAARLCAELADLSLLAAYQRDVGNVRLHDVIRGWLRHELGTRITTTNQEFIAAARSLVPDGTHWWSLPDDANYLWRQLCFHLAEAGLDSELADTACDLRRLQQRILRYGVAATDIDLSRTRDPVATTLRAALARQAPLLGPIQPEHSHADLLCSRLADNPQLRPLLNAFTATLPVGPLRLINRWPLPPIGPDQSLTLAGHANAAGAIAVSPQGTWLATSNHEHQVRIRDIADGHTMQVLTGLTDQVAALEIAPDGTWLTIVTRDGTTRLLERASGSVRTTLSRPTSQVNAVSIAANGGWLVTAGRDGALRQWNTTTGQCIATLNGHVGIVNAIAIAPDSGWLATAANTAVRLWETTQGHNTATLTGHTDTVTAVAIGPDGRWLATASLDGTIRLWQAGTGQTIAVLTGHSGGVNSVAISPDGTMLATSGEDGTIRVWHVERHENLASMRTAGTIWDARWLADGSGLCLAGSAGIHALNLTSTPTVAALHSP